MRFYLPFLSVIKLIFQLQTCTYYDLSKLISFKRMSGEEDKMEEVEKMVQEEEESELSKYNKKIKELQEKQEILKYSVAQHQDQVRAIYKQLHEKKQKLYELVIQEFNKKKMEVDIGIFEEFNYLKKTIQAQNRKIQHLTKDIDGQGLAGINNDQNLIKVKSKKEEIINEIELAKKFASTQYARDYLERPQIYRVAYEEVKYDYEMKIKLKENLQLQKQLYEKKKDQLNKAIQVENQLRQALQKQKSQLLS